MLAFTTFQEVIRGMSDNISQMKTVRPAVAVKRELEAAMRVIPEMKRRGIRVLPRGDYGFAWNPIGTNARDLEHFIKLFGRRQPARRHSYPAGPQPAAGDYEGRRLPQATAAPPSRALATAAE
jgi:hypothetical protein